MLRPSPNHHGTQRLPNDDDDDDGNYIIVRFRQFFILWDFVLWDFVSWDFIRTDFVRKDFVLWNSVPYSDVEPDCLCVRPHIGYIHTLQQNDSAVSLPCSLHSREITTVE